MTPTPSEIRTAAEKHIAKLRELKQTANYSQLHLMESEIVDVFISGFQAYFSSLVQPLALDEEAAKEYEISCLNIECDFNVFDIQKFAFLAGLMHEREKTARKIGDYKEALERIAGDRKCECCDNGVEEMPCTCFDFSPRECAENILTKHALDAEDK